jgi:formylglycine-generating enzyme required for sulfatase activity
MNFNSSIFRDPLNPVEAVNYSDAIVFANERSKLNGLDTIYEYESIDGGNINGLKTNSEIGFRLPYEDEWELAARGGIDSVAFLWLDTTDYIVVNEYLWFNQNAGSERTELPYALYPGSQKVALKKANEFGLYDMLGNVDEWTNNYWQSNEDRTDGRIDDKSPISCTGECLTIDSEVFENEYQRVVRGGHWALGLSENSLSARRPQSQSVRTRNTGFRLVINGREAQ